MRVIEFHEGVDELGTQTANVAVVEGDLYAQHTSFRRGGCLYAGTVVVRNFKTGTSREIDVTSRASDSESHLRYLLSLAEKHVGEAKAAEKPRSVKRFERALKSAEGIYYRLDKGLSGGRNARSTDATLAGAVAECRALLKSEVDDDSSPLYAYLDSKPKVYDRWNRVERRFYGCRV